MDHARKPALSLLLQNITLNTCIFPLDLALLAKNGNHLSPGWQSTITADIHISSCGSVTGKVNCHLQGGQIFFHTSVLPSGGRRTILPRATRTASNMGKGVLTTQNSSVWIDSDTIQFKNSVTLWQWIIQMFYKTHFSPVPIADIFMYLLSYWLVQIVWLMWLYNWSYFLLHSQS